MRQALVASNSDKAIPLAKDGTAIKSFFLLQS
jgi:hypothetical protein